MSLTLDYVSPDVARRESRWPWRALCVVAASLLLALAGPTVPVRSVESRVDAVSGSITTQTVWPFGITAGPRVEASPLETRLKAAGITWAPSWRPLHNTHRNIFGSATCRACGSAPPIYQIRPVLAEFAAASTDAELAEFVRCMQSGTDAEQRAAVDAAGDKGLEILSSARRGG